MNDQESEIVRLQTQIQSMDKMASLGMLSAGIAHEIQNPLNFVINFSKMSDKLLSDLKEVLDEESENISADAKEEIEDLVETLKGNLAKIEEHGNRANSIIRNILLYSRGKEDEFVPTDIPKLVKEYVWLSYHAMRANDKSFNVSIKESYPESMPLITVIPQDLSRALLNIFNNAFYAMKQRVKHSTGGYQPTLNITVGCSTGSFSIVVEDNGIGMTDEVKNTIFTQLFTTKPAGEGTGLGLMITGPIIRDKHKGQILVESEPNEFTRFTFILPIK